VDNYDDVMGQLVAHGLEVDALQIDTPKPVRCRVAGRGREKRGWYWLATMQLQRRDGSGEGTFVVGSYGIWEGSEQNKIRVQLNRAHADITAEQRMAIAARHRDTARRAEALRKAEAERAALKARAVWAQYQAQGVSEYLNRKGVQAHGVRFDPHGAGTIAVPMNDPQGRIHGLQIIRSRPRAGQLQKEYWPKGHAKRGHFFMLGLPGPVMLLAEGFATAATLYEATGLPAVCAFDANNLLPVAEELRKVHPRSKFLICADDDYQQKCKACGAMTEVTGENCSSCGQPHGRVNPGHEAAKLAAMACAGAWVTPQFPASRNGQKLTDFNDLYLAPDGGLGLVRDQVREAIAAQGWKADRAQQSFAARESNGGGGGRRSAQAVMEIEELIQRFVPLDDGTGKAVFDHWTKRVVHKDQVVAMLPKGARWDDLKADPLWRSRGAFFMDEVGFDPSERDPEVKLNTWQGWEMEPVAGSCQNMLDLIDYLCSGPANDPKIGEWLLDWMAYPLQNPGAKMGTAVIMHGPQGTGKSAVFQTLTRIYGRYATVLNQRGLEDRFNADWVDSKLFLLAEEVVARAEMWHVKNELKELVTGERIRINPKNVGAYTQRNHINIVYLSNEAQPLPIDADDRRHAVIWTPPPLPQEFYEELFKELDGGGVAAFYHHLLHRDLSKFHPSRRPPMTEAKQDLIQISKPSEDRFLDEWRAGELAHPFGPCVGSDLFTAYLGWCRSNGVRFPREGNQFLGRVRKLPGWSSQPRHVYDNPDYLGSTVQRRIVIPDDAELARVGRAQPEAKSKAQWLTDSYFAFKRTVDA
jgi:putative DNA primase/helicase